MSGSPQTGEQEHSSYVSRTPPPPPPPRQDPSLIAIASPFSGSRCSHVAVRELHGNYQLYTTTVSYLASWRELSWHIELSANLSWHMP